MKKIISKLICIVLIVVIIGVVGFFVLEIVYRWDANRLIDAIEQKDITKVEDILQNGANPNITDIKSGWWCNLLEQTPRSPISVACAIGDYEIVKTLIDYGATVQKDNDIDQNPLVKTVMFYYQDDDIKIVDLLLQNGADPNLEEGGRLPVFWAADMTPKRYDRSMANGTVFSSDYDEETAKGITQIVVTLLGQQSINTLDGSQNLLMYAIRRENLYLTKYLLSNGCDPNHFDVNEKTAYDYALETENAELINLFK